jgi:hypothetical protein
MGWGTRNWRLCASNVCQYHPIPPNTTPIPPSNECQYHPQGRPPHANGSVPMPQPRWGRCLLRTHITYTQRSASDRALVFFCVGFAVLFVLLRARLATRRIVFWRVEGYLGYCTVGQVTPRPSGRRFLRSTIFKKRACFTVMCAQRLPDATERFLKSCILHQRSCFRSFVAQTKHALNYY